MSHTHLIKQKGRTFQYVYDFGDNWQHEITLEETRYFNPELRDTLLCLEGGRACPPEDVGSVSGYDEFCKTLADPSHEEHERYKKWFAGFPWYNRVFKSEEYDIDKVNCELATYLRWSRDRFKTWEEKIYL